MQILTALIAKMVTYVWVVFVVIVRSVYICGYFTHVDPDSDVFPCDTKDSSVKTGCGVNSVKQTTPFSGTEAGESGDVISPSQPRVRKKRQTSPFQMTPRTNDIIIMDRLRGLRSRCTLYNTVQHVFVPNCASVLVSNKACIGVCKSRHIPRMVTNANGQLLQGHDGMEFNATQELDQSCSACVAVRATNISKTVTCDDDAMGQPRNVTFHYDMVSRCRCRLLRLGED